MARTVRPMFKNTLKLRRLAAEKMVKTVKRKGLVFAHELPKAYRGVINTSRLSEAEVADLARIAANDAAELHPQVSVDRRSGALTWVSVGSGRPAEAAVA